MSRDKLFTERLDLYITADQKEALIKMKNGHLTISQVIRNILTEYFNGKKSSKR